ncbi:MAG: hypothetical protein QOD72_3110 [Acidimicrobiaceae bacterium]|jgi:hypothetical protein|nr:hypothetical protein [Acidimicrobiaceae bacterium]
MGEVLPVHDRGQALPLVVGVLAVIAVLVAALGVIAGHSIDAARARTAADAAALAGVESGRGAAAALAHANGGVLVEFETVDSGDVLVRVRVGRATAAARATLDRAVPSGPVTLPGWSPQRPLH